LERFAYIQSEPQAVDQATPVKHFKELAVTQENLVTTGKAVNLLCIGQSRRDKAGNGLFKDNNPIAGCDDDPAKRSTPPDTRTTQR
jgi:hypothetical protein